MANTYTLKTASYDGRYLELTCTQTQNISANTSTIAWTLSAKGGASNYYSTGPTTVKINGEQVYYKARVAYSAQSFPAAKGSTSGSITVKHNSDGSLTIPVSLTTAIYTSSTSTKSGSWELDKILRSATITNAPNFNDEENPTITYSNPAGNAVTSLQACIANSSGDVIYCDYRAISKTGTSYTFTLTDAERKILRKACTTANSMGVKFYIRTDINGTLYFKSLAKTLTIINAAPTLSPTAKDTGSVSVTLTGDANNKVIKGYNNMSVAANATAKKEATIKSYKISCGGKSITTSSGNLGYVDSGTFTFSVTDSRGNTTTKTLTKTLIDYVDLTCNLVINAPTTAGDLTFTVKGNCFSGSFGAVNNTLSIQYRYKTNDGSYGAWKTLTPTLSGNTYKATGSLSGLDYQSSFTFQAKATDEIKGVNSAEKTVKTTPVFDWGEDDFKFNVDVNCRENLIFKNGGVGIRGTTTDGAEIQALQPCNSNNNLSLGYGGYTKSIGASNIYGNEVKLISKGSVYVNGMEIAENNILWQGEYYMTGNQTASLSEAVSKQAHGVVLIFSQYADGAAQNWGWNLFFVPKAHIDLNANSGYCFMMTSNMFTYVACKYLYIRNNEILGNDANNTSGTAASGIKYNNERFVLRYVIGV